MVFLIKTILKKSTFSHQVWLQHKKPRNLALAGNPLNRKNICREPYFSYFLREVRFPRTKHTHTPQEENRKKTRGAACGPRGGNTQQLALTQKDLAVRMFSSFFSWGRKHPAACSTRFFVFSAMAEEPSSLALQVFVFFLRWRKNPAACSLTEGFIFF